MKQNKKTIQRSHIIGTLGLAALIAVLLLASTTPCLAGKGNQGNPGIIPPQAHAFGTSYSQLAADWWTWAWGLPPDENPVVDPTGEICDSGQQGKVWFLAGTFGGPAERHCTVPTGKAIFFPLLNWSWWEPDDHEFARALAEHVGVDPDTLSDEELMRLAANYTVDHTTSFVCIIDGVPVDNLWNYRAESPAFDFFLDPELGDLLGLAPGYKPLSVADGYWLLLAPLSPGEHTIEYHSAQKFSVADGDFFDLEFTVDILYHLTVAPGK